MDSLIYIEGGSYTMGDIFGDGKEDEKPVHKVTLSNFYLDKYPITVGDFKNFVDETGYKTSSESPENLEEQQRLLGGI